MARDAGFDFYESMHVWTTPTKNMPYPEGVYTENLERFAALVAAAERERSTFELAESYRCGWDGGVQAEREACAKACDIEAQKLGQSREALIAGICAASIRERGKK